MLLGFILEDAQPRSASVRGRAGCHRSRRRLDAQFRRLATFLTPSRSPSTRRELARAHRADGAGSVARPAARRRGARREHVGARRRRGSRRPVRNGRRRRRVRARGARTRSTAHRSWRSADTMRAVHRSRQRRARQLARARLGHDAADVVVRHAHVPTRDRPHRIHRHVAVDRLGARPLRRAADQPRAPDARERCDSTRSVRSVHDAVVEAFDRELPIDRGYGRRAELRPNGASRRPIESDGQPVKSSGRSRRRPAHAGDAGGWTAAGGPGSSVRCRDPPRPPGTSRARVGVCHARRRAPGSCAPPCPPGMVAPDAPAGTIDGGHHEVPLVVAGLPLVDADRRFLALAVHAHDAAADGAGRRTGEGVLRHSRHVRESARRLAMPRPPAGELLDVPRPAWPAGALATAGSGTGGHSVPWP